MKGDNPHDVALLLSLVYEPPQPRRNSLTDATVSAALRMAHK